MDDKGGFKGKSARKVVRPARRPPANLDIKQECHFSGHGILNIRQKYIDPASLVPRHCGLCPQRIGLKSLSKRYILRRGVTTRFIFHFLTIAFTFILHSGGVGVVDPLPSPLELRTKWNLKWKIARARKTVN